MDERIDERLRRPAFKDAGTRAGAGVGPVVSPASQLQVVGDQVADVGQERDVGAIGRQRVRRQLDDLGAASVPIVCATRGDVPSSVKIAFTPSA